VFVIVCGYVATKNIQGILHLEDTQHVVEHIWLEVLKAGG